MLNKVTKTILTGAAVLALSSTVAIAQTTLRIQTHSGQSSPYGVAIQKFVDNVNTMSGGDLQIEAFYGSSVVPSAETFDAAKNGILAAPFEKVAPRSFAVWSRPDISGWVRL